MAQLGFYVEIFFEHEVRNMCMAEDMCPPPPPLPHRVKIFAIGAQRPVKASFPTQIDFSSSIVMQKQYSTGLEESCK